VNYDVRLRCVTVVGIHISELAVIDRFIAFLYGAVIQTCSEPDFTAQTVAEIRAR
jgi:hypothetical protein